MMMNRNYNDTILLRNRTGRRLRLAFYQYFIIIKNEFLNSNLISQFLSPRPFKRF